MTMQSDLSDSNCTSWEQLKFVRAAIKLLIFTGVTYGNGKMSKKMFASLLVKKNVLTGVDFQHIIALLHESSGCNSYGFELSFDENYVYAT